MTTRDPCWLAGYRIAASPGAPCVIPVPVEYDECQSMDFVMGCIVGARDYRNARIMDEIERETAQ